jgi:hypothetical protein
MYLSRKEMEGNELISYGHINVIEKPTIQYKNKQYNGLFEETIQMYVIDNVLYIIDLNFRTCANQIRLLF